MDCLAGEMGEDSRQAQILPFPSLGPPASVVTALGQELPFAAMRQLCRWTPADTRPPSRAEGEGPLRNRRRQGCARGLPLASSRRAPRGYGGLPPDSRCTPSPRTLVFPATVVKIRSRPASSGFPPSLAFPRSRLREMETWRGDGGLPGGGKVTPRGLRARPRPPSSPSRRTGQPSGSRGGGALSPGRASCAARRAVPAPAAAAEPRPEIPRDY